MKLYSEKIYDNKKRIRVLGVTVYKKENKPDFVERKYLGGLIKSKKNERQCKLYFLGIQIYKKDKKFDLYRLQRSIDGAGRRISNIENMSKQIRAVYDINASILANMKAVQVHPQTFGPYENINFGRDVVLICGGPTAQYFEYIDNAVYVSVNNSCCFRPDEIKFDYCFIQELHIEGEKNIAVNEYKNQDCVKFYGIIADNKLRRIAPKIRRIPQSYMKAGNIKRYYLDDRHGYNFAYDLNTECLGDFGGTAFSAMQFILWTNPKRIYIVGADCSSTKCLFYEQIIPFDYSQQKNAWIRLKNFIDDVYPDVEVVSVNPVGLKGIFKDEYTDSYLQKEGDCLNV